MDIRAIGRGDIADCLKIYNFYILNSVATFEETPLSLEEFTARVNGIVAAYPFIVAENDGKILGFAYLSAFNARSAYRKTADLSIYLDKSAVRSGIGRRLLAEIENRAKARGITEIISIVTEENADSVKFHEKCGFTLAGVLKNVGNKFGRNLSIRYYQKSV